MPEGTQLEQNSNARSRVKLAVFFVLTIHVVGLMALLVQGCRPEDQSQELANQPEAPIIPPFEAVQPPPVDTNSVLLPPVTTLPPATDTVAAPYPAEVPGAYVPMEPSAPPATSVPEVTAPPAMQQYAIQKGDTFYSIGRKFGVSTKAIADANPGVDPKRLRIGQTIQIPPPPAPTAAAVPSTNNGQVIYTVVSGDNLSKIAKKYGTTWKAIYDANNLQTVNIKVGQKLKIPVAPPPAGAGPASGR